MITKSRRIIAEIIVDIGPFQITVVLVSDSSDPAIFSRLTGEFYFIFILENKWNFCNLIRDGDNPILACPT
jgi:hypothetical protein